MSDWTDEDGNSLGEWVPCSEKRYVELLDVVLGDERTVFASRTEMGDAVLITEKPRNRHIHTEWGRKGADAPLARCERDWDSWGESTHLDYEFVRAARLDAEAAT